MIFLAYTTKQKGGGKQVVCLDTSHNKKHKGKTKMCLLPWVDEDELDETSEKRKGDDDGNQDN